MMLGQVWEMLILEALGQWRITKDWHASPVWISIWLATNFLTKRKMFDWFPGRDGIMPSAQIQVCPYLTWLYSVNTDIFIPNQGPSWEKTPASVWMELLPLLLSEVSRMGRLSQNDHQGCSGCMEQPWINAGWNTLHMIEELNIK